MKMPQKYHNYCKLHPSHHYYYWYHYVYSVWEKRCDENYLWLAPILSSSVIPTLRTICSHSSHDTDDHRAQDTGHVSCHIPVCRNHVCLLISPSFIISHLQRFQFLYYHHKRHINMFLTTGIVLTILSTSALTAKDNAVAP